MTDPDATNVAEQFQRCIEMGFYVHLLGIVGDASFAARVYVKKVQWFRLAALIACSLYSLLWLAWLIWLHVVVFNHGGRVCSGAYLSDDEKVGDALPGYALHQGQVLLNIIIGIWTSNVFIVIMAVVIGIFAGRYLKGQVADFER